MKNSFFIFLFIVAAFIGNAQELRCQVDILSPTLQSDPENTQVLEQLKTSIYDFMNNTKWTTEKYKEHEKIEVSLLITINTKSGSNFGAKIQVSSRRPIFNSDYKSTIVNTLDGSFDFVFQLNAPIIYTQGSYANNLSAVLAYYAYYIIGMDNDTYSLEGGTKYLLQAQEIANLAQSSGQNGWAAGGDQDNRYWIVENLLNAQFKGMRKCSYEYHRLGLDIAYENPKEAVVNVTKALGFMDQVHQLKPGSVNMRLFFVAKSDEVVNIYSEADNLNKQTVFNLVRRFDPANSSKYQKIVRR